MDAAELVYESKNLPEIRGDYVRYLCDAIEEVLGPQAVTTRCTNGQVADTLLRFIDMIVVTPEQEAKLKLFLDRPPEE